jgi:hypothetical protein
MSLPVFPIHFSRVKMNTASTQQMKNITRQTIYQQHEMYQNYVSDDSNIKMYTCLFKMLLKIGNTQTCCTLYRDQCSASIGRGNKIWTNYTVLYYAHLSNRSEPKNAS